MSNQTVTELKEIASKTATINGFDLISLKTFNHSNPLSIQVNIRHTNPQKKITIDDCAHLTQFLDEAIQKSSIIDHPYTLEISSEGVSEILIEERDFEIFKGFPIEVTYEDLKKIKQQTNGLLLKRTDNHLEINQKGKILRVPVEDVFQVRLTTPSG